MECDEEVTEVALRNKSLTSLDEATQQKSVARIDLFGNYIGALEGIQQCLSLKSLDVTRNRVQSLLPAFQLPMLQELRASANPIRSVDGIERCLNLRLLDIGFTAIREKADLERIVALPKLVQLRVPGNRIKWDFCLGGGKQLEVLDVSFNDVSHASLQWMAALPCLQELEAMDTGISTLEGIAFTPILQRLFLSDNEALGKGSLQPAFSAGGLLHLGLEGCRIRSLAKLTGGESLQRLDLGGNRLTSLETGLTLSKLESLDVCSNSISQVGDLHSFPALEVLDLSDNKIKSVAAVRTVFLHPGLRRLSLSLNPLGGLAGIPACPGLEQLELVRCGVRSVAELSALQLLPGLRRLNLDDNEAEEAPNFMASLRSWAPRALVLGGTLLDE